MPRTGRTKQTARKSTGGLAPRKQLATRPGRIHHGTIFERRKFIPVKLDDIMKPKFITRRQKYTEQTMKIYKHKIKLHRDSLMDEVKSNTIIGNKIKNEMNERNIKIIPKNHLMSINKSCWNCDDPKVRDEIRSLLTRDWKSFEHNVSNKSFTIGEIIDTENPAVKHGLKKDKYYGLFAVKPIKQYTLLFEYTGVVTPVGEAAKDKQFDHFNLIGHLDENRDKNIWGANPEDELVIDPSICHNEGLYINDYRHNITVKQDLQENESIIGVFRQQNVEFHEVLVDAWPHIFAVACRDINPGEELLTDYGNKYWDNYWAIRRTETPKGYHTISNIKHILLVFGYVRTKIEEKYNFRIPNEIKCFCSKWAEFFLDTCILSYNEINNFIDVLCSKSTVALPLKDESFKLLYRSSEHGLSASKFHELCDDKGPTVTFIHNSYDYVFGGYTCESWKMQNLVPLTTLYSFRSDKTAFLYNIRNKRMDVSDGYVTIYPIQNNYYGYTKGKHAICCGLDYLPTFGNGSDIDVRVNGNKFCCLRGSYNIKDYSKFCGEKYWEINEIEVFSISVDGLNLIAMDKTDSESQKNLCEYNSSRTRARGRARARARDDNLIHAICFGDEDVDDNSTTDDNKESSIFENNVNNNDGNDIKMVDNTQEWLKWLIIHVTHNDDNDDGNKEEQDEDQDIDNDNDNVIVKDNNSNDNDNNN